MFDFSDIQKPDVVIWLTLPKDKTASTVGWSVTVEIPLLMDKYRQEIEKLKDQGFSVLSRKVDTDAKISHPGIESIQIAERLAFSFEAQGLKVLRQVARQGGMSRNEVPSFILA